MLKITSNQAILFCWFFKMVSQVMVWDTTTRFILAILLLPTVHWCLWKATEEIKGLCSGPAKLTVHMASQYASEVKKEQRHFFRKAMTVVMGTYSFTLTVFSLYLALMGWDPSLGPRALPFPGEFFLANAGDIEVVLWGTWKRSRIQKYFP